MDHTEAIISQHYYWPKLSDKILTHIKILFVSLKQEEKQEIGYFTHKESGGYSLGQIIGRYSAPYWIRR